MPDTWPVQRRQWAPSRTRFGWRRERWRKWGGGCNVPRLESSRGVIFLRDDDVQAAVIVPLSTERAKVRTIGRSRLHETAILCVSRLGGSLKHDLVPQCRAQRRPR